MANGNGNGNGNGARYWLRIVLVLICGALLAYLAWVGSTAAAAIPRAEAEQKIKESEERTINRLDKFDAKLDTIMRLIIEHQDKGNQ